MNLTEIISIARATMFVQYYANQLGHSPLCIGLPVRNYDLLVAEFREMSNLESETPLHGLFIENVCFVPFSEPRYPRVH
jgi:hypothetical protein